MHLCLLLPPVLQCFCVAAAAGWEAAGLQLLHWLGPLYAQMCDFPLNPFLAFCWVAAGAALASQLAVAELLASANWIVAVAVAAATVAGAAGTLLVVLVR